MVKYSCSSDPCGNWEFYDNNCYKLVESSVTWDTARQGCESENAALVTIDNSGENAFVGSLSTATLWIGLNDISQEGIYVWVSGSTSAYRSWSAGQPDNFGNEDCVHMLLPSSTVWNDLPCTSSNLPYVCEKGQLLL